VNTLDLDLELIVREEPQDGYLATLYGRAVPYGQTIRVGGIEETVEREAFDPAEVVGKPLAWRHGEPIGIITAADNQDDGLYITAGILDTAQGRDANTLLRGKAVKGLSVGFQPVTDAWNKAKTAVTRVKAAALEVSLTHMPAYSTAGVSAIREEQPMETTETVDTPVVSADVEAREQIAELRNRLEAVVNTTAPEAHPLAQYRDAQHFVRAIIAGDVEERALNVSALSEQTGLIPPVWFQDIKGVMDRGRPCINALGGPGPAGDSSMDLKWPISPGPSTSAVATTGGVDGTEVASADHDITVGSATLVQYAGANRLPYLVIERSSPAYLQAYLRHMVGSYNVVTDYAFQAALWANDTIATGVDYDFSADTTGALFIEHVWAAAVQCQTATGFPAEVVYVSSAVFSKLAGWSAFNAQNYPVQNTGGVYDGTTLRASIMGLPVVLAAEFATNETEDAIVTNRYAVGWAEDGPRFSQADQPGFTSRDIAIYGFATATPWIPSGIVSIYNAP